MQRTVSNSFSDDYGKALENIVFLELKRRKKKIFYFHGKQEVDFVLVDRIKPIEAIQVCAHGLAQGKTRERELSASNEDSYGRAS